MSNPLPPLSQWEHEILKQSIEENGILIAIVKDQDGNIVDGHHRMAIVRELGLDTYPEEILHVENDQDRERLGVILNTVRRQLSPDQTNEIYASARKIVAEARKKDNVTQKQAAAIAGVSRATVASWEVEDTTNVADNNGGTKAKDQRVSVPDEEHDAIWFRNIGNGEKQRTIAADYKVSQQLVSKIVKKVDRRKKLEAEAAAKREEARKRLAEIAKERGPEFDLDWIYEVDILPREFSDKMPESFVDLMIADPPWSPDDVETYAAASRLALKVLKPGAYLFVFCGKMHLPEIIDELTRYLDYCWTFCAFQPDSNTKIQKYHLYGAWRPIMMLKKEGGGLREHEWMPDSMRVTRDKRFHEWGQGEKPIRKILEAFTKEGDMVLDPYSGGGTVAAVCKDMKRRFLAYDVDPEAVKVGLERLATISLNN